MILINSIEYNCKKEIEYYNNEGTEHLHIEIEGELPRENKLTIEKCFHSIFGYKTLPTYKDGYTKFDLYIFKEGDSEAE